MDYNGPYSILANECFKKEFIFVELWYGYLVAFLVKSNKEALRVANNLSILCECFGPRMEKLRVDFGTVEREEEFVDARFLSKSLINQAEFICLYRFY